MLNLNELQFLAQIVDSMEMTIEDLEKSYKDNNGADFQNSKKALLEFQGKISNILESGETTRK